MKKYIIGMIAAAMLSGAAMAQEAEKKVLSQYYRNALTNMMVYHPEDEFGYDVYLIFNELPPQERYDKHDINLRVIDNSKISGVAGSKNGGLNRQTYGASMVLTDKEKQANADALLDLLNRAEVGKRMVAKWFNLTGTTLQDAHFGTQIIEERSGYNASMQEAEMARYTIEGAAALQDVSTELMNHSFVLVSDMTYITAEDRGKTAKTTMQIFGAVLDAFGGGNAGQRMAEDVEDIADSFTGFKVFTHSYLFQLVWNEDIANHFYQYYYTDTPNPEKIRAFLEDQDSYKLIYLGTESAKYEKTKLVSKYNREDLLQMITARSIDNNIAKLQKRFEAFRVKAPVTQVEYDKNGRPTGYRAQIGTKEGVEDNMKFEVLECRMVRGKIEYRRVAVIKPVRNKIWDNRFNALLENDADGDQSGTLFRIDAADKAKAGSILPGMVIRQID